MLIILLVVWPLLLVLKYYKLVNFQCYFLDSEFVKIGRSAGRSDLDYGASSTLAATVGILEGDTRSKQDCIEQLEAFKEFQTPFFPLVQQ